MGYTVTRNVEHSYTNVKGCDESLGDWQCGVVVVLAVDK